MKANIFLLLVLVSFPIFAQKVLKRPEYPNPPNGVQIRDSLFYDETEIANIHWLEYLSALKTDSSEAIYQAALPDQTVWYHTLGYGDPYIEHYFRYPRFRYFPVVGITPEQAKEYCRWRSNFVNEGYKDPKSHKRKYRNWLIQVDFRLPTLEEWSMVSDSMKAEKYHSKIWKDDVWNAHCFTPEDTTSHNYDHWVNSDSYTRSIPDYIYNYPSNDYGIYNLLGNVSEIIEGNRVVGGNSQTWYYEINAREENQFEKPNSTTGFRCACVVSMTPRESIDKSHDIDTLLEQPLPIAEEIQTEQQPKQGVLEVDQSPKIIVLYPNPVYDVLRINLIGWNTEKLLVTINDLTGNLIKTIELEGYPRTIEVKDLATGIYIFTIEGGNYSTTERIMIE